MAELPVRFSTVGATLPGDNDTRRATVESQIVLQQLWDAVQGGSSGGQANLATPDDPSAVQILSGNVIRALQGSPTVNLTVANNVITIDAAVNGNSLQTKLIQSTQPGSIDIYDGVSAIAGLSAGYGIAITRDNPQNIVTITSQSSSYTNNVFVTGTTGGLLAPSWLRYDANANKVAIVAPNYVGNTPANSWVVTNGSSTSVVNYANFANYAENANSAATANFATNANRADSAWSAELANNAHYSGQSNVALEAYKTTWPNVTLRPNVAFTMAGDLVGGGTWNASNSNAVTITATFSGNSPNGVSYANNAGNANYANYAGNVNFAGNAGYANYAANAGNAVLAMQAEFAVNAGYANTTGYVDLANRSLTADSANTALVATNANYANYAGEAATANTASTATNANYANVANYATYAGTATNANYATNAGTAANAVYATNAGYATSAGSATTAFSASIANHANSAGTAVYANDAGQAAWATNAGFAANANYATYADSIVGNVSVPWANVIDRPNINYSLSGDASGSVVAALGNDVAINVAVAKANLANFAANVQWANLANKPTVNYTFTGNASGSASVVVGSAVSINLAVSNANYAQNAYWASNADYALQANTAISAGLAALASNANYAINAGYAATAGNVTGNVNYANYANYASYAGNAPGAFSVGGSFYVNNYQANISNLVVNTTRYYAPGSVNVANRAFVNINWLSCDLQELQMPADNLTVSFVNGRLTTLLLRVFHFVNTGGNAVGNSTLTFTNVYWAGKNSKQSTVSVNLPYSNSTIVRHTMFSIFCTGGPGGEPESHAWFVTPTPFWSI